jgi:hypothetical protein
MNANHGTLKHPRFPYIILGGKKKQTTPGTSLCPLGRSLQCTHSAKTRALRFAAKHPCLYPRKLNFRES